MFEIISEEQVAASGRIYIPEENQPFYYGKLSDIRTSEIADRIELDTEDAYKEFLLRGVLRGFSELFFFLKYERSCTLLLRRSFY